MAENQSGKVPSKDHLPHLRPTIDSGKTKWEGLPLTRRSGPRDQSFSRISVSSKEKLDRVHYQGSLLRGKNAKLDQSLPNEIAPPMTGILSVFSRWYTLMERK